MAWIFVTVVFLVFVFHRPARRMLLTLGLLGVLGVCVIGVFHWWTTTTPSHPVLTSSLPVWSGIGLGCLVALFLMHCACFHRNGADAPSGRARIQASGQDLSWLPWCRAVPPKEPDWIDRLPPVTAVSAVPPAAPTAQPLRRSR